MPLWNGGYRQRLHPIERFLPNAGRPALPVKGMRAARVLATRSRRIYFSVLLPLAGRQLFISGLAFGAPASIPRWLAAFWFASSSAASRLNRGSASCTARRCATATWTKRAIGLVSPNRKRSILDWRRQYRKRISDAQEAIFLSPDLNISHISTQDSLSISRPLRCPASYTGRAM